MELAGEKRASSWLSVVPVGEHNLDLHKSSFRDALCMRYGWQPFLLLLIFVCDKPFTVEQCLSCTHGDHPILRHNELRNITANLLGKVGSDVCVHPSLQPLSGKQMHYRSSNQDEVAHLDVAATNFWSHNGQVLFNIRVFNPLVRSNYPQSLNLCYRGHEQKAWVWSAGEGGQTWTLFTTSFEYSWGNGTCSTLWSKDWHPKRSILELHY